MIYVLLDDEGEPVRYFDYAAEGTVPMPQSTPIDWDNYEEALL